MLPTSSLVGHDAGHGKSHIAATITAMSRPTMILTGERTAPGIWHENYWFRRHEVVYEQLRPTVFGKRVLEAGCGEGYGAALLAGSAQHVAALDYDEYSVSHVRTAYPKLGVARGNLVALPFANESFGVVVSLQTIEHLWDQTTFLAECARVLKPGGELIVSTPNTLTFPPGNIYHPKELTAAQLHAGVSEHLQVTALVGLHHGERLRVWERQHGSLVDAQIAGPYSQWSTEVCHVVESVTVEDFDIHDKNIDGSLDLIVRAVKE